MPSQDNSQKRIKRRLEKRRKIRESKGPRSGEAPRMHRYEIRQKTGRFARMKLWGKILLFVVIAVVAVVAVAGAYLVSAWNKVDTETVATDEIVINEEVQSNVDLGDGYTNIAIFGVDSREGLLESGTNSDVIIIASLNNETKEIKLVSVYRDTLLNLSNDSYRKCNAAYSVGGATMAISMLNMNLDLDIEDYVTVDFEAIADTIDLLGGVEITLEEEELEAFNKYVQETASVVGKDANTISEAGTYLLDGVQATTYARIRSTAGGDFTRTERQRLVIEKMMEKIQEADLSTLNEIVDEVFPQISTSLTLQEILTYVQAYREYSLTDNTGFPFETGTDTLSGLGSIVYPLDDLTENVVELHEFLFGTEDYSPSSVVQEISANISAIVGSGYSYSEDTDSGGDDYSYSSDTYSSDSYSTDTYSTDTYSSDSYSSDDSSSSYSEPESGTESSAGSASSEPDSSGGSADESSGTTDSGTDASSGSDSSSDGSGTESTTGSGSSESAGSAAPEADTENAE